MSNQIDVTAARAIIAAAQFADGPVLVEDATIYQVVDGRNMWQAFVSRGYIPGRRSHVREIALALARSVELLPAALDEVERLLTLREEELSYTDDLEREVATLRAEAPAKLRAALEAWACQEDADGGLGCSSHPAPRKGCPSCALLAAYRGAYRGAIALTKSL